MSQQQQLKRKRVAKPGYESQFKQAVTAWMRAEEIVKRAEHHLASAKTFRDTAKTFRDTKEEEVRTLSVIVPVFE